jgi:anti-sigma regulatory factor (Ser/Thr protein kinase)
MSTFATTLPRAAASIQLARELVGTHGTRLTGAHRDDARLMVSELVTNALRHGQGVITLGITPATYHLTVEVADEGHGEVVIAAASGASGGWGLRIVDELADAWGFDSGSTRVWFRLPLTASTTSSNAS